MGKGSGRRVWAGGMGRECEVGGGRKEGDVGESVSGKGRECGNKVLGYVVCQNSKYSVYEC